MEEGTPMCVEAGAGSGMDVAATLVALYSAFPAISATADDARGKGGGGRWRRVGEGLEALLDGWTKSCVGEETEGSKE